MMQEYCIREKQRQIEEIQDNYTTTEHRIGGGTVTGLQ